jgi:hypothetical protein
MDKQIMVLPTKTLDDFERQAQDVRVREVWELFCQCPVLNVRRQCLNTLRGSHKNLLLRVGVDDIERAIKELVISYCWNKLHRQNDRGLALKLLDLYLFADGDFTERTDRTILFTLSLTDPAFLGVRNPLFETRAGLVAVAIQDLAKPLCTRLCRSYAREAYLSLGEPLSRFLTEVLEEAFDYSRCEANTSGARRHYDWELGLRALKVISCFQDHRFTSVIERICTLIEEGRLLPPEDGFLPRFQHFPALRELGRQLAVSEAVAKVLT